MDIAIVGTNFELQETDILSHCQAENPITTYYPSTLYLKLKL